jgi:hypothetical protein
MKVAKYFRMAQLLASQGDSKDANRRYRLGAVGVRTDGVVLGCSNLCVREKCPEAHAEYRTAKMMTPNSTLFVVRIGRQGEWRIAKPCQTCTSYMKNKKVKRVYYTISPGEYGVIKLS